MGGREVRTPLGSAWGMLYDIIVVKIPRGPVGSLMVVFPWGDWSFISSRSKGDEL